MHYAPLRYQPCACYETTDGHVTECRHATCSMHGGNAVRDLLTSGTGRHLGGIDGVQYLLLTTADVDVTEFRAAGQQIQQVR